MELKNNNKNKKFRCAIEYKLNFKFTISYVHTNSAYTYN